MPVTIRPLTQVDAQFHQAQVEALSLLIGNACLHPTGELIGEFLPRRWEMSLAAWDDDVIVGIALAGWRSAELANSETRDGDYAYPADSFYLDHFAVDPAHQKQRVGQQLLRKWLELTASLARREGMTELNWSLETDGQDANKYVTNFYEKRGAFKIAGHRTYGEFHDIVMWRTA